MKSAIQLIREVDRGQLLADFEAALEEIVNAIEMNGGSGEMTIKLGLKKKGDAFLVSGKFSHSIPQPPRVEALMFFDAEAGEFTRKDPRQPVLPAVVEADFRNRRSNLNGESEQ